MIGRILEKMRGLTQAVLADDGLFDVWQATGLEKDNGERFSFVYAGLRRHLNYLVERAFADGAVVTPLARLSSNAVAELATKKDSEAALVIYEAGSAKKNFNVAADFKIPVWVTIEIDLDGDAHSLKARPEFSDARRFLKKYAIEAEYGRERADFDEFFTGMYDPYIRKTKGDAAYIEDREALAREFKTGEILFILHEGKRIGGLLMTLSQGVGRLYCLGFTPKGEELARTGLVGAMYLMACQRLRERAATRASFGFTRGFLTDGPMRFKARLGGRVSGLPHAESGFLYCKFLRGTPALRSFLLRCPFLTHGVGGYEANYFVDDASLLDAQGVRTLVKDRFCQGADLVNVYSFSTLPTRNVDAPQEKGIRLVRVYPSPTHIPIPASKAT